AFAMLVCLPAAVCGQVRYSADVKPRNAIAGEKITLTVICSAGASAGRGPSLDHKSLTIRLTRPGSAEQPHFAFPNRRVVTDGNTVFREGEDAPPVDLQPGEKRSRTFDLTPFFSSQTLQPGDWEAGF